MIQQPLMKPAPVNKKAKKNHGPIELSSGLRTLKPEFISFCRTVTRSIARNGHGSHASSIHKVRQSLKMLGVTTSERLALLFCKAVTLDLAEQGWKIVVTKASVHAFPPRNAQGDRTLGKEFVRGTHLFGRNIQLNEKSVISFVKGMERKRLTEKGWHSIFSLMRDGPELTERLREVSTIPQPDLRVQALSTVVDPYLQFVESDSICEHTGLRLRDIWRYFRHTWVNEYKSTPGRSISILIRDAAAPNHPVIGIAGLGSSVAQHKLRDMWIGWHPEKIVEEVSNDPSRSTVRWLLESVNRLIRDVHVKDLFDEGLITKEDLKAPPPSIVARLYAESLRSMQEHHKNPQRASHKEQKANPRRATFWKKEAETFLFRSKRCGQLAKLLEIRRVYQNYELSVKAGEEHVKNAFASGPVRSAIRQLVRMIKAEHMGIDMMDITVCGAIAPYNALLGGKLVCMLLCSPEVVAYYSKKYDKQVSVIASGIKGRAVTRTPNLVLLCTTSLYGVGSSQYNRVRIPLGELGIRSQEMVYYHDLGHSEGFGTYHFSRFTIEVGNCLNARKKEGRRVNSIFGEGVNPLMRKIREALDHVGMNSDALLQHGNKRVTYGIGLARNFRRVLLGRERAVDYLIPPAADPTERTRLIAGYWRRRWLSNRIERPDVLDIVTNHVHTYPPRHGAVVPINRSHEDLES